VEAGKKIVPIIQKGVRPDDIPAFPSTLEFIEYDPSDYAPCLANLKALTAHSAPDIQFSSRLTPPVFASRIQMYDFLSSEEVRKVFWMASPESRRPLEDKLQRAIQDIIYEFLTTPTVSYLLNIGALRTDDYAVILRLDTLHALLRAARQQKPASMRLAGYEAGALYGIGVLQWFLAKTGETRERPGLPVNSHAVIEACLEIDRKAGLGRRIELKDLKAKPAGHGWSATLVIENQFLEEPEEAARRHDEGWREAQRRFWQGYLEGAFSASLGTWYWVQRSGGHTEPTLYSALCTELPSEGEGTLLFCIQIESPKYEKAFISLQQEIFGPHLQGETTRIVARARTVIDEFIRELADAEEAAGEDMVGALTWLARAVPNEAKEAVARLQTTRNVLHKGVHVSLEPSERAARSVVRATTGVILQACHDIHLEPSEVRALRNVLSRLS
jgi:hypothetical protein